MSQTLNRAIIQINVRNLQAGGKAIRVDRVTVILRSYVNPPRLQVLDRVVSPPMAKFQLEGIRSQSPGHQLVPQAYPHHGHPTYQAANVFDNIIQQLRVSRSRRKQNAGRI